MGFIERKIEERMVMKWAKMGVVPISAVDAAYIRGSYKRETKAVLKDAKQRLGRLSRQDKKDLIVRTIGPEPPIKKRGEHLLIDSDYLASWQSGHGAGQEFDKDEVDDDIFDDDEAVGY
ncbi:MAG: hypothetical protein ACLP01_25465 [Solirubrobacteraceae bacterium]